MKWYEMWRYEKVLRWPVMTLMASLMPCLAGAEDKVLRLADLDLKEWSSGWGRTTNNAAVTGKPLRVGGREFAHGVGTHAVSEMCLDLDGQAREFRAWVGVDDGAQGVTNASIVFQVLSEEKELWSSSVMKAGQPARECRVPLRGIRHLFLFVADADDGIHTDHADWGEAEIRYAGAPPRPAAHPAPAEEEAVLLTPPPPNAPRINGPKVYGARPGRPFLYRIPATGNRPIVFGALGLPEGLQIDPQSGIITGRTPSKGEYAVRLTAQNASGKAERVFKIVAGDTLALTPPMGWNDWYTHYNRVTDDTMRQAADAMVASGMADHGYQYVNIDDCWMFTEPGAKRFSEKAVGAFRDAQGNILPNRLFPDMKALTDYIHAKGLKAGLYTSPGPHTCAGYCGSYQHEEQDARQFAAWGFDFLKYDWCSYGRVATGEGLERLQKPYRLMGDILRKLDRDIVYNLCQYGMGEVWNWGGDVGGHSWRTTDDLGLERATRLPGFYTIGFRNAKLHEYAAPGRWNDPDYILIGWYGIAHELGQSQKANLTPNEQYSYMSMWCLMAAPLFFSGDMSKLDAFTVNVLCNHEVIEVDQDVLGRQGRIVRQNPRDLVLAKPLEDGSLAVGLFALGPTAQKMKVTWRELGIEGPRRVRDLWRQKDTGTAVDALEAEVPRHGVAMLKLSPPSMPAE